MQRGTGKTKHRGINDMDIFMIGAERSGSELLTSLLKQIPGLSVPHSPDILRWMTPVVPSYGDISSDQQFQEMVEDTCKLVELSPVPWPGGKLNRKDIVERATSRSLLGIFEAIYDSLAQKQKTRGWCCTSVGNVQFLPAIEAHFGSKAKYIYIYRDGRDVAVSQCKAPEGEKHFYHIAREWGQTQRLAMTMQKVIGPERFLGIRYEYMARDQEQTLSDLCAFLGVEFTETLRLSVQSEAVRQTLEPSQARSAERKSPILKGGVGRFRVEADDLDIQIFESVAGDVLDRLGYVRSVVPQGKEKFYREDQVKMFNLENDQLKRQAAARLPGPSKQAGFVSSIMSRSEKHVSAEWLSRLDKVR
jgi:LPS sulfotransferase NodH